MNAKNQTKHITSNHYAFTSWYMVHLHNEVRRAEFIVAAKTSEKRSSKTQTGSVLRSLNTYVGGESSLTEN